MRTKNEVSCQALINRLLSLDVVSPISHLLYLILRVARVCSVLGSTALAASRIVSTNFLRSSLYPILEVLGIEKQGFHGFRRFRVTHLESSCVPPALVKYWTGHAKSIDGEAVRQTVTDRYIKMGKDTKFRAEVAERIGLGFELPKAKTVEVVPSVPSFQKTEVTINILKIRRRLAPRARFELATLRLTAECSTVELPGNRCDARGGNNLTIALILPQSRATRWAG